MLPGRNYGPEDLLHIAWTRKWIIAASLVLFTGAAIGASWRIPDKFKSQTLILVIPQRIPESYVRSTITERIEDRLRSISQQILSRSRLERVIEEFNLYPEERMRQPMEEVVRLMTANIEVETVKDDAFRVSFTANSPRTAMIVAERLAAMFIDENLKDREVLAKGTDRFLETQLEDARRRLVDHEKKLEEFRRRYSGELPSQLQTNLQVIQGAQNQIQNLTESINRDRDRRLVLEKSMADALVSDFSTDRGELAGNAGTAAPLSVFDQLQQARAELRTMELRLKPNHPDVIAKKRLISGLEQKAQAVAAQDPAAPQDRSVSPADAIRQARARRYKLELDNLDRQTAAKEAEVERLRESVTEYRRRIDAVPRHESELTELMRDYDTLQKIYASLLANREGAKISANLERQQAGEQFRILDAAKLPEKPFSPDRVRIALMAAGFGLAFGIGLVGFFEYRDTSMRTEDDIVRTLTLPVIATIPMLTAVTDRRRQRVLVVASLAAAGIAIVGLAAAIAWYVMGLKGAS